MNSIANMKVQIVEMKGRKEKLATEINKAAKQYKFSLWTIVIGVFLIPLYGIGLLPIAAGGLMAFINANKRAQYRDELENLDSKIHKLNSSMA